MIMGKIVSVEDLKVWQKSIEFCDEIFHLINSTNLSKDFALRDQMNRCAISIPSNIAEGFERNSPKSFIYFLKIAKGSVGELRTQLHLAKRRKYLDEQTFQKLNIELMEIGKMIGSFIIYLKNNDLLLEPEEEYLNLPSQENQSNSQLFNS